ncbi:YciI family protein [Promicromonospora kroppenstedtii]|uniref:YciI family protein n=1 Tax=Promicromonospora kroppenstedtii TaxID=440482 RepID=UPI0004AE583D|nr:YciI family protein [Promicromonospora kroppenstedtii]
MTDTWVFLIRENDWDSDAYLPENAQGRDRRADEDMAAHGRFQEAVADLGAKISGAAALQNAKYGGWVAVGKDGAEPVYTDAPFTDTNEVITGFYQVDCDEATARKIAALVPSGHVVEWRKVLHFGS